MISETLARKGLQLILDNKGATDLYSLVEYKVGKDASFEDDYIIGKYGAIPFIGNFKELIG
ncbi:hypothetical protein [Microcoleus sp. PH2017_21_RUC_O_A]|uniref:hypothetical protein n=1 Tax=Microcoleus sp. PH2017_21_RUC_O_A TaxID=2798832 RepID=UPI0025E515C5|nr:hypothetical protein [Microcoleus sp. PH2017_21_RUC_O_A]